MDRTLLASCYADVIELARKCKSKKCTHEYQDSTCAVREAVKQNELTTARLKQYQQACADCSACEAELAKAAEEAAEQQKREAAAAKQAAGEDKRAARDWEKAERAAEQRLAAPALASKSKKKG